MALGDLAFEETGKFAGIRVLPDGKVEATYQGTGKLFGADYSSIYTGVATPHGGTLIAEFNGICTTKDGDTFVAISFRLTSCLVEYGISILIYHNNPAAITTK
jgi:hypothetical protein